MYQSDSSVDIGYSNAPKEQHEALWYGCRSTSEKSHLMTMITVLQCGGYAVDATMDDSISIVQHPYSQM
ncbi:hypothetical protein TNCV_472251 [Trichonephila clavipes]|nr:hypothetical protein TNCV_472251 [Trichonephila clavipes]